MKEFNWKSAALFTLSSIFVGIVTQACSGHNAAFAQSSPVVAVADPIEGLWQSSVTLKDCASDTTIGAFRGLTTFNQGGTASADNKQPSATKGVALGTWKKTATGYQVDLRSGAISPTTRRPDNSA